MIQSAWNGIHDRFDAENTLQAALTGGFYFQELAADVASPWGVGWIDGVVPDHYMGGAAATIEDMSVRIQVFSRATDGGTEIADLIVKVMDCFDESSLTISGFTSIRMGRTAVAPILFIDNIWQGTVLYDVIFAA